MSLNEVMEQRQISIYKLSKSAGIPYATLHDVCAGKSRLEKCSADTVYKLATTLGVSMETLLEPSMNRRQEFEEFLKEQAKIVAENNPELLKVYLFGSRADGTDDEDSDVDLLLELSKDADLLTLSGIKIDFEELLGIDVDVVHSPIPKDSLLIINKKVLIYDRKRQKNPRKNPQ